MVKSSFDLLCLNSVPATYQFITSASTVPKLLATECVSNWKPNPSFPSLQFCAGLSCMEKPVFQPRPGLAALQDGCRDATCLYQLQTQSQRLIRPKLANFHPNLLHPFFSALYKAQKTSVCKHRHTQHYSANMGGRDHHTIWSSPTSTGLLEFIASTGRVHGGREHLPHHSAKELLYH